MDVGLIELPWLATPPANFRQEVRRLSRSARDFREEARQLATYRLDNNGLHNLGHAISRLAVEDPDAIKLGVLSNGTTDLLLPALSASALRHGVWVHTVGTAFDQVAAEALDPASDINRSGCQFVLLALDHRGLPLAPSPDDPGRAHATVNATIQYVCSVCKGLQESSPACTVILQTAPQVGASLFGSMERDVPGTWQWLIEQYNRELRAWVRKTSNLLLDTAALAESVGLARWHDPVQWTLGKFAFALEIVPLYADWLGRLIAAARGKTRKCLVLDLDNTLWGGVVGDDGVAGIVLGNGSPAGEAFLSIQRAALALRERGIVLAVSSKNDDAVARSVFRSHPEMLLKEEHIAVFQANWQDKASNLRAIAETLSLGIDSLVLLDDNPAERAQVRDTLPTVAVPELPADPVFYAETLLAAGYFEAVRFTAEDRSRASQYQANAARAALLGAASDLDSYLHSLEMRLICTPFDAVSRARITQLINKSNQFNLTTRRYTESQVAGFESSDSGLTLQVRLIDRFGDNGIIATVICIEEGPDWVIDTWLMSCRVLNRKVERATLNVLVASAKEAGVSALLGEYFKTERNGLVKDHFANLGFTARELGVSNSRWRLDIASYVAVPVPMEIIEAAREPALV
jgi:FkbH-like protein